MAAFWIGFFATLAYEAMLIYGVWITYYYGRRLAISLRVYWLGVGAFVWDCMMVGIGLWIIGLTAAGLISILF